MDHLYEREGSIELEKWCRQLRSKEISTIRKKAEHFLIFGTIRDTGIHVLMGEGFTEIQYESTIKHRKRST